MDAFNFEADEFFSVFWESIGKVEGNIFSAEVEVTFIKAVDKVFTDGIVESCIGGFEDEAFADKEVFTKDLEEPFAAEVKASFVDVSEASFTNELEFGNALTNEAFAEGIEDVFTVGISEIFFE